ncbi:MAG: MMPL family transporter [Thermoanaerobacterales bacterium]|nr:MMPL family transporter [Thermoanaerobacterales bacterium]
MLRRWGHFAATHHWWVIGTWVVLVPALWVLGLAVGGEPDNTFTLPGSPSQDAQDRLEADFPAAAGASATVVYHSRTGADLTTDTSVQQEIEASLADISGLDGVASVTGPFRNDDLFSEDGSTALANVVWTDPPDELPNNGVDAFEDLDASVAQHRSDDLQIELGGTLPGAQPTDVEPALVVYGLVAALVILAVALATWWSFAWPVVGALAGVGLGVSLVRFLELAVDVPTISETAAVMIGLGVGIDYGLFVVGRAKDHVEAGEAPVAAAGRALDTVGRAVLTAGATVVVALGALLVFDVPAVTAMAYAVVVVVTAVVLAALTLQPAIIGAVGPRLARGRVPWSHRADPARRRPMRRWADLVTRVAPVALAGALVVLLVLAIPVFRGDLRLGPLDNSLYPTDSTQYRAWELQSEAFGPGSTDPFLVVVEIPSGDSSAQGQVTTLVQDVAKADGVATVTPPQVNSDGSVAAFEVIPTTDAQAEETAELVDRLRDDTIPNAVQGTGLTAEVAGRNAIFVDLDDRIGDRLPTFIGLVILVALVILGAVFRSLAIPIKAAVFDVVTILATYGVLVAFLTFGWGRSWVGIPQDLPVLSLLAPVFFAVLFGLSNDYEVYLVSRMHEEREGGADPAEAVRRGLGGGGRIVVAAALIMVFVFVSYVFQPGAAIKQFGFGMAAAIVLDAFVTRMIALPAAMRLGGDAMWWPGRRAGAAPAARPTATPRPDAAG